MTTRFISAACLALFAQGALAEITLSPPIDCDLGRTCFIQQYVDHDTSSGAKDFTCAPLSYDTHKGTDFALRTYDQMLSGVNVLAAAPGVVRATRDGEPDRLYGGRWGEVPSNRACGNGLIIDHADGWSTQYCHLRQGSVAVAKGQQVGRGDVLGFVGLSGRTQFPHVHMTLRRNNKVVDPFDPDGQITCGRPNTTTLWDTALTYRPGGVLDAGFSDAIPDYNAIKAGRAHEAQLPGDAPAIVLFGYAFGGRKGDVMSLRIDGPRGTLIDQSVVLEKNQAQFFRAAGKKRTQDTWPKGRYDGTVQLLRQGQVINTEKTQLRVR